MIEHIFKRKAYQKMLQWKQESHGETALLIEGARRVGKSTLVRQFAKNEYKSFALFDFSKASKEEKALFEDLSDMDFFFTRLKLLKNDNAQQEYYITDLVEILKGQGKVVKAVKTDDNQEVQGINDVQELARAEAYLKERG